MSDGGPTSPPFEYRRDGWPLCPQCGEDELFTTVYPLTYEPNPDDPRRTVAMWRIPIATDPMQCYRCRWTGSVPRAGTSPDHRIEPLT